MSWFKKRKPLPRVSDEILSQFDSALDAPMPQQGPVADPPAQVQPGLSLSKGEASPPKKAGLGGVFAKKKDVRQPSKNHPIRVILGYLPEVTAKDALGFALGIAEKHTENLEMAYYEVFPVESGYVYEVHEGGTGCAFTPAIKDYFESLGVFRSEVDARMHIPTATRTVEVTRKVSHWEAVLLPERGAVSPAPSPNAGPLMRPAIPKRQGALYLGAGLFVTGFFAMLIIGSFMRITPLEEINKPPPTKLLVGDTPLGQWLTQGMNVPPDKYIKALRFNPTRKWYVEYADIEAPESRDADPKDAVGGAAGREKP